MSPPTVHSVKLGEGTTLDVVRVPQKRVYLLVLAERGPVQKRVMVQLTNEQAMEVARFLANVRLAGNDEDDTPTDPNGKIP